MNYKIIRSRCDCHPETCCCWNYYIVNSLGQKVEGFDMHTDALHRCIYLNANKETI